MKTSYKVVFGFLTLAAFSMSLSAQDYSIDWHSIDGGGGTSSGGEYTLSGTIGQSDATTAPITGSGYSLTGGFWSFVATVEPNGDFPALTISLTSDDSVAISWPSSFNGFVLQEKPELDNQAWTDVTATVNNNGNTLTIIVPATQTERFYRLIQQ
jgi:hypothetical protein